MIKQFLDREKELKILEKRWKSEGAEFLIIYGRRRIGKSELIDQFLKDKKGVRLLAREESEKKTLERFSEGLGKLFNDRTLLETSFKDWDSFFNYLGRKGSQKVVIALDEFPLLIERNKALPSILQDHWDSELKNSKIFLILCGSSIGMMEEVMGHKSPLYGRRTGQLLLKPFSFREVYQYIEDLRKAVEVYSTFGGTPAYLVQFNKNKGLIENLREKVFRMDSFLVRDVEFILREELRKPHFYFSILDSIAKGLTKLNEIVNETGLERSTVGRYLSILEDLRIIEREVPITKRRSRSRKGIYKLKDNFFKFWFRFVYPNQELIERSKSNKLCKIVEEDLDQYVGPIFEKVCQEALWEERNFNLVGRWWHKDNEIDIVALNERENRILLGECKWSKNKVGTDLLKDLKRKAKKVRWKQDKRKETYALFSKSGFTKELEKLGEEKGNLELFDLKRLEKVFS